jgi:dTDP-4-amino-4,6-dideoxygalactose transaminase
MKKNRIEDLALLGGKPAFDQTLHVGRPNIGDRGRLLARFNDMLDRDWLTNNGPFVQDFERKIEQLLGVKHCIAMCNGTVALEIAARALNLKGEVIVPSFTFISTAHCLQWQEITPVFCDVDPETYTIDPGRIESLITPRTSGIIGVHLWGNTCRVDAIEAIAEKHGLKLLFDASHSFGCSYRGRRVGSFGCAETFSFHATKFINTFEGGAVVTNDDNLAEKMRLMKNFGFAGMDRVIYIGTNGKMTEIAAAMGITSLEDMECFIACNRSNYRAYRGRLEGCPGLKLMTYDEREKNNYQYVVLEIDPKQAGISRDELLTILHAEGVRARRYFYPGCHRMEPYRSYFPHAGLLLPVTERLADRVLCLPTGTQVQGQDIDLICDLIQFITGNADSILPYLHRERLAQ